MKRYLTYFLFAVLVTFCFLDYVARCDERKVKPDSLRPISIGAFTAASAADLYTTQRFVLSNPYARETNPLIGNLPSAAVTMTLSTAATVWASELLRKKHKWIARSILFAGAGLHGWAAWHNSQLRR